MRFPQAIRFPLLLIAALATMSVVSSLSIPRKLDVEPVLNNIAKRAIKHVDATSPSASPNTKESTARKVVNSSTPAPAASHPSTSSAAAVSTPASSSSALHSSVPASPNSSNSSNSSNVSMSSNMPATQTGLNTTVTGTGSTIPPVPTGGLSAPAVGGIAAVAGVAVFGAVIFAVMRYKRKASLTQNLGTKSINQYSGTPPYNGGSSFPSGANTGYERLSDPHLSGAMPPVGAPSPQQQQESLRTYTVISTYTPTLGDELEIQPGDKVTLLVEYDDGWCQGINESRGRVKGVFPKHCVDLGGNQGGMDDMEKSKRVSSMYGAAGYRM